MPLNAGADDSLDQAPNASAPRPGPWPHVPRPARVGELENNSASRRLKRPHAEPTSLGSALSRHAHATRPSNDGRDPACAGGAATLRAGLRLCNRLLCGRSDRGALAGELVAEHGQGLLAEGAGQGRRRGFTDRHGARAAVLFPLRRPDVRTCSQWAAGPMDGGGLPGGRLSSLWELAAIHPLRGAGGSGQPPTT